MAMMEEDAKVGKKKPNKLIVEEAVADDNSVISLNSATMDTLELFRYSIKKKPNKFHSSPGATQFWFEVKEGRILCALSWLTTPVLMDEYEWTRFSSYLCFTIASSLPGCEEKPACTPGWHGNFAPMQGHQIWPKGSLAPNWWHRGESYWWFVWDLPEAVFQRGISSNSQRHFFHSWSRRKGFSSQVIFSWFGQPWEQLSSKLLMWSPMSTALWHPTLSFSVRVNPWKGRMKKKWTTLVTMTLEDAASKWHKFEKWWSFLWDIHSSSRTLASSLQEVNHN